MVDDIESGPGIAEILTALIAFLPSFLWMFVWTLGDPGPDAPASPEFLKDFISGVFAAACVTAANGALYYLAIRLWRRLRA